MTDIDVVDELRGFAGNTESARASLMRDAAAEIERLRSETEKRGAELDKWARSFRKAHEESGKALAKIERLRGELEQARQQVDNQAHNVRTILDDRREVIKATRQAHDVLANSKYRGRDRVARRILRPYIEEPDND